MGQSHHDVIIVGAGQSGLAAGHALARRGVDFVILEAADRVGDVWRSRYDSLVLYSRAQYDALPGLPFPLPAAEFPTGRQMGDYLESYAAHHDLPVRTGVSVDAVEQAPDGGYRVRAADERFTASQVIIASGPFREPKVPGFAGELDPAIRQVHSADYRAPDQLRDGPVLVVGLAHSGADLAMEAVRSGHETHLSGRSHGQLPFSIDTRRGRLVFPILKFLGSHVLTLRTPVGRRMAPKIRMGGGPLLRHRLPDLDRAGVQRHDARTVGVRDGRPMLDDGTVLDVANVIWCTGFRPSFDWIRPTVVGDDGWPVQERGVATAASGLYFLGLPFLFSFTSMLVAGAARDAAYVADRIAERLAEETAAMAA